MTRIQWTASTSAKVSYAMRTLHECKCKSHGLFGLLKHRTQLLAEGAESAVLHRAK